MNYQIVIATPLGELVSKVFDEDQKNHLDSVIFKQLGSLNYFTMVTEDGAEVHLTKDMIGSSVFFVKKVEQ